MTEGLWVPERPWSMEGKLTSRTLLNRRRESSDRKRQRVREKSLEMLSGPPCESEKGKVRKIRCAAFLSVPRWTCTTF